MGNMPKTADDWLEALHHEFHSETDRAAVIVVASMVDEALRLLLDRRLIPPLRNDKGILESANAPLGTFSARISAAHQLGLISKFMAADLHTVRKIRNEFAHNIFGCTFESQSVKDRISNLQRNSRFNERNKETRKSVGPPGQRWDFLGITAWMLYALHREAEGVQRLTEHLPEFGYYDLDNIEGIEVKSKDTT